MNIKLTEAGYEAANQSYAQKQDGDQLFEVLTEEERNYLKDYLKRIIAELEKQIGDETDAPVLKREEQCLNRASQHFFYGDFMDWWKRCCKG